MNNFDRINYYLNYNCEFSKNNSYINIYHVANNHYYKLYEYNLDNSIDELINFMNNINSSFYKNYLQEILDIIRINSYNGNINILIGDNRLEYDNYMFVKTRSLFDKKSIILKNFNYNRHWNFSFQSLNKIDTPFIEKKNKVIWRGATTGYDNNKVSPRKNLVEKWFNFNANIDIGFSLICQNSDELRKYKKDKLSKQEILTNKFIIAVEGNDKPSGLNWNLASNSVVMMPKPTICSWLMEDKLVPGKHYILLKDDFSDLFKKFRWAVKNLDKCEKINKNAKKYMSQFMNLENEKEIERKVLNTYFKGLK